MSRSLILGLDTGGTHTDAVVFDPSGKSVLASAKAGTTHHELSLGLAEALKNLSGLEWPGGLDAIGQINLSTTLATNAIAEGKASRVGLILSGYDRDQAAVQDLVRQLPLVSPVFVSGSHDFYGAEDAALDEAALMTAIKALEPTVETWAASGFFSIKNPAHEFRAAQMIKELSSKPVTLGQSLTGRLNAVRRAATAALNAGLVPIIGRLLDAVKKAAGETGLEAARLMVVKGDGTLVSEDWAREKPIETVVSGPAAGLLGARLLARGLMEPGEKNLWVMDVGGTTTDLAYVEGGLPAVDPDGARVGAWQTMTMAVDTRTRGLGGDSLARLDKNGGLVLGPRRVLPLGRLAAMWPGCLPELERQARSRPPVDQAGYFFVPGAPAGPGLTEDEEEILEALKTRPAYPMTVHSENVWNSGRFFAGLASVTHPAVMVAAFTPTDAMAVLGLYQGGNLAASRLGANFLARRLGLSPEELARRVLDEFGRLMAQEILSYALGRDHVAVDDDDFSAAGLLGQPLGRRQARLSTVGVKLNDAVALLGAPVHVLAPWLGKYLPARILVPPCYDVASAAGAAASPIHLSRRVEIQALPHFVAYRLFLPGRILERETLDELLPLAEKAMTEHMLDLAHMAGAKEAAVSFTTERRQVTLNDGSKLLLGAAMDFTARAAATTGRPLAG